jgi:hypothetical protein
MPPWRLLNAKADQYGRFSFQAQVTKNNGDKFGGIGCRSAGYRVVFKWFFKRAALR